MLNRVPPNGKLAAAIRRQLPNLAEQTVGNRVGFAAALMEGRCVTETAPRSPAAEEIKALTKELWQVVTKPEKVVEEQEAEMRDKELA